MKMESGVSAILIHEGKILLQLRDNDPNITYPNYWGLLGGSIKENEVPHEAIKREIMEEIGFEINNLSLFRTFTFNNKKEFAFLGKINKKSFTQFFEGQDIRFFDTFQIKKLKIRPDDKETIEEYLGKKIN